jgi:uncharacterized membrane protein YdcZ (DUF606 family)
MYILLPFLAGVTIVINMMISGELTQKEGMINGVFINYLVATISSFIMCAIMIKSIPAYTALRGVPLPYFLGGFIGVLTTYLANVIVPKVPAVYVVLLRFIGQMITSAIIDYAYFHIFSAGKVIGGMLFITGLIINVKFDNK